MTSDGDALFRAICEHPKEDTPRLVYADWLQENEQPERAEFVRLQCEAWGLCPGYPTLAAARTRASHLLRTHGNVWYNELPFVPGLEWGDLFVRGFIDSARTVDTDDVLETLDGAFAAAPLRFLRVTQLRRGQLQKLLTHPRLPQLVKLSLPGTLGDEEHRELEAARKRLANTVIT